MTEPGGQSGRLSSTGAERVAVRRYERGVRHGRERSGRPGKRPRVRKVQFRQPQHRARTYARVALVETRPLPPPFPHGHARRPARRHAQSDPGRLLPQKRSYRPPTCRVGLLSVLKPEVPAQAAGLAPHARQMMPAAGSLGSPACPTPRRLAAHFGQKRPKFVRVFATDWRCTEASFHVRRVES